MINEGLNPTIDKERIEEIKMSFGITEIEWFAQISRYDHLQPK